MTVADTFLQAAGKVLRASGKPMTASGVTRAALSKGLIATSGRMPEAYMPAALYTAVNRNAEGPIRKVAQPGQNRAVRGSVTWEWRGE